MDDRSGNETSENNMQQTTLAYNFQIGPVARLHYFVQFGNRSCESRTLRRWLVPSVIVAFVCCRLDSCVVDCQVSLVPIL